jgi:hypothetical protein
MDVNKYLVKIYLNKKSYEGFMENIKNIDIKQLRKNAITKRLNFLIGC